MKKYKLLKDIPGVKAGAIYSQQHNFPDIYFTPNSDNGLLISYLKKYPDFFEEVIELEKVFDIQDMFSVAKSIAFWDEHVVEQHFSLLIKSNFPQHIDQLKHLK